jgi:hypothetical protein
MKYLILIFLVTKVYASENFEQSLIPLSAMKLQAMEANVLKTRQMVMIPETNKTLVKETSYRQQVLEANKISTRYYTPDRLVFTITQLGFTKALLQEKVGGLGLIVDKCLRAGNNSFCILSFPSYQSVGIWHAKQRLEQDVMGEFSGTNKKVGFNYFIPNMIGR